MVINCYDLRAATKPSIEEGVMHELVLKLTKRKLKQMCVSEQPVIHHRKDELHLTIVLINAGRAEHECTAALFRFEENELCRDAPPVSFFSVRKNWRG